LHVDADYDLSAALAHPRSKEFRAQVVAACKRSKNSVVAGAYCGGAAAAAALAAEGFGHVAFDADLNVLIAGAQAAMAELSPKK
jgi:hypothetical protein